MGGRGAGVRWVVAKAKTKEQDDTMVEFVYGPHAPIKGQFSTTRPGQMCADSGSDIRSPLQNWSPPLAPFHQSWIYMVGKITLDKQTS